MALDKSGALRRCCTEGSSRLVSRVNFTWILDR
uniref:Uncharacterized protein n=1 Tax=Anguilla anguilla TaxID=7936 RepID=A0A0E9UFF4_ANGAN